MKWSEIVSMTLDLLQRDSNNMRNLNASSSLRPFANKGLILIANKHKPRISQFVLHCVDKIPPFVPHRPGFPKPIEINYVLPDTPIEMPNDFLSHNGMIQYFQDYRDKRLVETKAISYNTKFISVPRPGIWYIYYNALWPEISTDNIKQNQDLQHGRQAKEIELEDTGIDASILSILHLYMASQMIFVEDPGLSQLLLNKFEAEMYELDNSIYQDVSTI